jgi:hypothetical protein
MSLFPEERDAFWNSLTAHDVPVYFCGHYHLYCRGQKDGTWQIIGGTGGGAPGGFNPDTVDPDLQVAYPDKTESAGKQGIGYTVITVDVPGGKITGEQKQYQAGRATWKIIDSFSLPVTNET